MPTLTARFATVVTTAGQPVIHLAWLPVEKDPALKTALAELRVMTIHQVVRGAQKDFGMVGFEKGAKTQILLFPKSLRKYAQQRIVGINYDLIADAPTLQPHEARTKNPPRAALTRPVKVEKGLAAVPERPRRSVTQEPAIRAPAALEEFPLTWEMAAKEIDRIAQAIRTRPQIATQLARLSARMKAKLKPH